MQKLIVATCKCQDQARICLDLSLSGVQTSICRCKLRNQSKYEITRQCEETMQLFRGKNMPLLSSKSGIKFNLINGKLTIPYRKNLIIKTSYQYHIRMWPLYGNINEN